MAYKEEEYLQLSGIQHFCYCRRQWALIHVEQQWNENVLTAEGRLMHSRVHDENVHDVRNGILTMRGLHIFSSVLGLSGTCDAVEFIPSASGITLFDRSGTWLVRPVEYKNGETKQSDCDRLQTAAQVMCLEEMFCCSIPEAHIFYNRTRRREKFPITDELREKVTAMTEEMHRYFNAGYTPNVVPGKGCTNCSLRDLCLPQLAKAQKRQNVAEYIKAAWKEVSE